MGITVISKVFCLTVPKNFVWKISGKEKKIFGSDRMSEGGGSIKSSRFPPKFSWLTVSKKFVGEPFCVSKFFWYGKKFRDIRGVSRFSVENFLSHLVGKIRRGAILCFKKNIPVSTIFKQNRVGVWVRIRGVGITVSSKILSHSSEKLRVENFWYGKKVCG